MKCTTLYGNLLRLNIYYSLHYLKVLDLTLGPIGPRVGASVTRLPRGSHVRDKIRRDVR